MQFLLADKGAGAIRRNVKVERNEKIQKDDFKAIANFAKCRNGSCLIFLYAEFVLNSAFIYECVDQPRKEVTIYRNYYPQIIFDSSKE